MTNDCCLEPANRGPVEHVTDDLSLTRCAICSATHYELVIDEADLVTEVEGL